MAQWLRTFIILTEDLGLISATHVDLLTTIYNTSSRRSGDLRPSVLLWYMYAHSRKPPAHIQ